MLQFFRNSVVIINFCKLAIHIVTLRSTSMKNWLKYEKSYLYAKTIISTPKF